MKQLILKPDGWPCPLVECPPGLFVFNSPVGYTSIGFKTEYGRMEVYTESGEVFWGGAKSEKDREALIVQPVASEWEECET